MVHSQKNSKKIVKKIKQRHPNCISSQNGPGQAEKEKKNCFEYRFCPIRVGVFPKKIEKRHSYCIFSQMEPGQAEKEKIKIFHPKYRYT